MKKIFGFIFGAALLFAACTEKEKEPVLQIGAAPSFTAPASNNAYVLADTTANEIFDVFTWTAASFGFDAAVSYTLEMDKAGNDFADPLTVGTVNALTLEGITKGKINTLMLSKELPASEPSDVQFRLVAKVNPDVDPVYSDPITLRITPYQVIIVYPQLQVPGSYQGWKPEDNTTVIFSARSDEKYEGYIFFANPNEKYKFTKGTTWATNWGDNGLDGSLEPDGADIPLTDAGMYRLNVDLNALTHTNLKTTWGVVGSATGSWDIDQPMSYDAGTRKLTLTMNLEVGKIKFRANGGWDVNLGDNGANRSLEYGGADIDVAEAGNYTIELNLAQAIYSYKLTKN
ncbi:MAG: SusE domain-containing protein [Saprospiraceae bacterium]|nr:SusE domain-containing protein [Saprospiraceae bacterium]